MKKRVIKHLIVLSSPSGGGKTTIARHLMKVYPHLQFSVSATTRKKRDNETDGKDYLFLARDDFENKLKKGQFVEHEEIFGNLYGTLHSEIKSRLEKGEFILFDVDVKGALSLKKAYPEGSLLIFVSPPSIETLEARLRTRQTETEEQLKLRLERAMMEMDFSGQFDFILINDNLQKALLEAEEYLKKYI